MKVICDKASTCTFDYCPHRDEHILCNFCGECSEGKCIPVQSEKPKVLTIRITNELINNLHNMLGNTLIAELEVEPNPNDVEIWQIHFYKKWESVSTKEKGEKFWVVVSKMITGEPDHDSALKEAEELAREHIGEKYFILEATEYCQVKESPVEWTKL